MSIPTKNVGEAIFERTIHQLSFFASFASLVFLLSGFLAPHFYQKDFSAILLISNSIYSSVVESFIADLGQFGHKRNENSCYFPQQCCCYNYADNAKLVVLQQ